MADHFQVKIANRYESWPFKPQQACHRYRRSEITSQFVQRLDRPFHQWRRMVGARFPPTRSEEPAL